MTDTTVPDDLGATLQRTPGAQPADDARPTPVTDPRYRPGRELGRGGMGRVVEAVDAQFDRLVALKELLGPATPQALARFRNEALITGSLEHPGIPSVHELGVDANGTPFYAMQRVQGRTLTECCKRATTLRDRLELLPVVIRVAQTVGFAHARGVLHRDLKPDNVIVGAHGETYLLDWGIAKVKGAPEANTPRLPAPAEGSSQTMAGAVMGTPAYMAPEQALGEGSRVDERTDVFALGAMLFHVLTGRPPYDGTTLEGVLEQARLGQTARLAQAAPDVPAGLRALCERAMQAESAARFPDADAFAKALEGYTADALRGSRRSIDWLVNGIALAGGLLSAIACAVALSLMPSLHEQGPIAVVPFFLGLCAVVVAFVELLTRSRHHLGKLALLLGAASLCMSVGATAFNLFSVFRTVRVEAAAQADPLRIRLLTYRGIEESLGQAPFAFFLASLQLLMLGIAQWRAPKQ